MQRLLALIFATVFAPFFFSEGAFCEDFKVGAVLPLTGDLSFVGIEMQRGIQLALAEEFGSQISVVFEDDHSFDKASAISAARKLISQDRVSLLLSAAVNTAHAIHPVLSSGKVPAIILWDNNESLKTMGEYVFGMGYSNELAGEDMASYAIEDLKIKSVGIVSAQDEWSEVISKAFATKLTALGGKVTRHDTVDPQEKDMKSTVVRMLADRPDALYLPLIPPGIEATIRQIRQLGYKGYLLTGDGFSDNEVNSLGELANGIVVTQIWITDEALAAKYAKRFGADVSPINLGFVGLGYDAIRFASEIRKRYSGVSGRELAQQMSGLTVDGITGRSVLTKLTAQGKREQIVVVQDGKFVLKRE